MILCLQCSRKEKLWKTLLRVWQNSNYWQKLRKERMSRVEKQDSNDKLGPFQGGEGVRGMHPRGLTSGANQRRGKGVSPRGSRDLTDPLKLDIVMSVENWDTLHITVQRDKYKGSLRILQETIRCLMTNQERTHQVKVILRNSLTRNMRMMSMKYRLLWQEDKGNVRKGRKHERLGEGGKKKSLQHKPPPRYDRQWQESHHQDKQDGSQFWKLSGRNTYGKIGRYPLECWREGVDGKYMAKLCLPSEMRWEDNKREHKWRPRR